MLPAHARSGASRRVGVAAGVAGAHMWDVARRERYCCRPPALRRMFLCCGCWVCMTGAYSAAQRRIPGLAVGLKASGTCELGGRAAGRAGATTGGPQQLARSPRALPGAFPGRDRRGAARRAAAAKEAAVRRGAAMRSGPEQRMLRPSGVLALLAAAALLAPPARAQTYTNENLLGVQAYSAFTTGPSAANYAPYAYKPPPASTAGCVGIGGTCVPVTVAGNPAIGFWLTRGGMPYWITCVCCTRRA